MGITVFATWTRLPRGCRRTNVCKERAWHRPSSISRRNRSRRTCAGSCMSRCVAMRRMWKCRTACFPAIVWIWARRCCFARRRKPPEEGTFLDLGCGWGPIALTLGFESPKADIWALDVNERALELTRRNAELNGMGNIHAVTAEQVPAVLTFDLIWVESADPASARRLCTSC